MKNIFLSIAILASTIGFAQYDHNIQLNAGGTIIHSVTEIDSISFNTDGTPVLHLNLASGSTINYELGLINQVVFSGEPDPYPTGTVHCISGGAEVVDVINPSTGKTWMDRNLGAAQVATSNTDADSYGDLYQWGRRSDGHQCRNSATTSTLSSTDQPAHGDFIVAPGLPKDWRSPQNFTLWQALSGVNNPCPSGYRIPSEAILNQERLSWVSDAAFGAFASPLKLPVGGGRNLSGVLGDVGLMGLYWSSTASDVNSKSLLFNDQFAGMLFSGRAIGAAVRCLKN